MLTDELKYCLYPVSEILIKMLGSLLANQLFFGVVLGKF